MTDFRPEQRLITEITDWSPPQPPRRRCPCGTILRNGNPETWCAVCQRKNQKEKERNAR